MNNLYCTKDAYPVHLLPNELQGFIYSVSGATKATTELVAPIVLSAAAAAVQGVVDLRTPFETIMPVSLFFGVIARSGERKSTVLKMVSTAFEEFEQGDLKHSKNSFLTQNPMSHKCHPFLIEEASEQGITDIFSQGAQSVFYALDEGAILLRRLDVPALCKRFDGATIRHISRKEGAVVLAGKRASVCMLIQDVTFGRFMKQKGEILIESGLLPRMLMSFANAQTLNYDSQHVAPIAVTDHEKHPFHDRVRSLLMDYVELLGNTEFKRIQMTLNEQATTAWEDFSGKMDYLIAWDGVWSDVRPFVRRASEHVLRLAAVLQWFSSPSRAIEPWAVHAAIGIVEWHIKEAKIAFGSPPLAIQAQQLSNILLDYLNRRAKAIGYSFVSRSELLRNAPQQLRNAERLTLAIQQLAANGSVVVKKLKGKESIGLNVISCTGFHQYGLQPVFKSQVF